jgi:hypothetical protein
VLIAPKGVVDAGDAGIQSTGNVIIAAQTVRGADNIEAAGAQIGVPTDTVDAGALTSANNTAAAGQGEEGPKRPRTSSPRSSSSKSSASAAETETERNLKVRLRMDVLGPIKALITPRAAFK